MANPKPLLLDGAIEVEATDSQQSRREKQALEDEIRSLRHEVDDLGRDKERLERSIQALRTMLSPLHRALRAVFGEIELAVGEEVAAGNGASPVPHSSTADPRWQSFKDQFPGVPSKVIDALLIHGSMGMTNLSALLKRAYGTTKNAAYKLKAAGAVSIERGNVSLKR